MSRHAWAEWAVSEEVRHVLWESKERLKLAWKYDQADPKSYPMNTWFALIEIEAIVANPRGAIKTRGIRIPKVKVPKSLAELVKEQDVRSIWEGNHSGSFEDAIARAFPADYDEVDKSWKVFKGIVRAIELAWQVRVFGEQALPRPKVNFLHRGLNDIAKAAGIGDQTEEGFAEFLDDLCPCGLKSHREALRKAASRSPQIRRPKA